MATVDITETAILRAVCGFIVANVSAEAIVGQTNRVAEPTQDDFVIAWPLSRRRLATNVDTYADDGTTKTMMQATEMAVQLDVHGPNSTDNTQIITTLWRDAYGCDALRASGIQPLYIDDGHQAPFVNGEDQYEDRWVLVARLQANPTVTLPQQTANALTPGLIEVDAEYPPT